MKSLISIYQFLPACYTVTRARPGWRVPNDRQFLCVSVHFQQTSSDSRGYVS